MLRFSCAPVRSIGLLVGRRLSPTGTQLVHGGAGLLTDLRDLGGVFAVGLLVSRDAHLLNDLVNLLVVLGHGVLRLLGEVIEPVSESHLAPCPSVWLGSGAYPSLRRGLD